MPRSLSVVAAEDARPTGGPALVRLHVLADSDSRFIRAAAVRALGRLENSGDVADSLERALSDPAPEVRAAAANALAQAYFGVQLAVMRWARYSSGRRSSTI